MVEVVLNEVEVSICEMIAARRYKNNRENGVKDGKIGPQGTMETDLDGVGAEFSVAKAINLYPDMSISPRSGGVELIGRLLTKIDVKQTKYPNGRLLATIGTREDDADVYILVVGTMPRYKIVGWCHSRELICHDAIIDLGYGSTYGISQDKLRKFDDRFVFHCLVNESREPCAKKVW